VLKTKLQSKNNARLIDQKPDLLKKPAVPTLPGMIDFLVIVSKTLTLVSLQIYKCGTTKQQYSSDRQSLDSSSERMKNTSNDLCHECDAGPSMAESRCGVRLWHTIGRRNDVTP
jgi:hypothetical protein